MLLSRFRVSLASKPYNRKYTRSQGSQGRFAGGVNGAHAHSRFIPKAIVGEIDDTILQAAKDPVVNDLAEKILAAERDLAALFEPGKLMPSAGKVAKMRQSIMDMKGLLASKLNGMESLNPDAADGEAERARKLFFETQVERSLQRQQRAAAGLYSETSSDSMVTGASFDLTLLEVENDRLRDKAERLLKRQQMLEELAEMHQLASIEGGRLIWNNTSEPGTAILKQREVMPVSMSNQEPDSTPTVDRLERAMLRIRN